jgi:uncharacterized protein
LALIDLIDQNHPEAAFSLLEQNPELAEEVGPDGVSAAMLALYHGHKDLAETILSHKTSLDIFEAAAFGKVSELEKLCDHTEKALIFSPDGFQPLHLAAFFGRPDAVRYLVSLRAPLNELSNNSLGVTPLHSALANRHESIARELVYEGADVSFPSRAGWTSLHYAAYLGNRPLALFLKDHGAMSTLSSDGKTPKQIATEAGNLDLADLL